MNDFSMFTPEVSTRVCVTLLHSLWQVAALAAMASFASWVWFKRSVEWAYTAHVAALVLSFACIPVTFLLTESPRSVAGIAASSIGDPALAVERRADDPSTSSMAPISAIATAPPADMVGGDVPPVEEEVVDGLNWVTIWKQTAPWLTGFYAAGVGLMLVRLALGIARAERLRGRSSRITDGRLADALRRLADAWSMRAVPALATTEHIVVPKVVGLMKPAILMPASAFSGLSPDELEMILAHELAHVRRYDMWVNLLQRVMESALFFNPALWILSRRISSLREYCCDELACGALEETSDESHLQYAQALLRVAELAQSTKVGPSQLATLAASGRSPSELRRRVARLFGEPLREPLQLSRGGMLALAAVLLLLWTPAVWTAKAHSVGNRDKESAASDLRASRNYLEDVPPQATQVRLPHSGALRMLALGKPGDPKAGWWSPTGQPVAEHPDWVRLRNNFREEKLIAVLEAVYPNAAPPSAGIGPHGEKWAIPMFFVAPVSFARDGTATVTAGFGAGPWTSLGQLQLGQKIEKGDFQVRFTEFQPAGHGTDGEDRRFPDVTCKVRQRPNVDFALLGVDQRGKKSKLGATYNPTYDLEAARLEWTIRGTVQPPVNGGQFSHVEVLTRRRAWAKFSNFATEPGAPGARPTGRVINTSDETKETDSPPSAHGADDAQRTLAQISGKIVLEDGSPAKVKGWLYANSDSLNSSTSSTEGQFTDSFRCEVRAGTVRLAYFPDGYAPTWVGPFELAPGVRLADVTIILKPGFSEKMILQDEDGQRVPGATVVAHPAGKAVFVSPDHELKTNDQGELLLEHLANMKYKFIITAPAYQPLRTQPLHVERGEVLRPTMVRSKPALGIVRFADGTPAPLTKLRAITEFPKDGESMHYINEGKGKGFWGKTLATTDEHGRFRVDQLAEGSQYLFVVEAMDYARAIVGNLKAGQKNVQIVLPQRHDLVVEVKGDLTSLPKRRGRPFVNVGQPVQVTTRPDGSTYSTLIGADVTLEPTAGGGQAIFRGLAVDLRKDAPKQTVQVTLGYDHTPRKTVDVNLDGTTFVRFKLPEKTTRR